MRSCVIKNLKNYEKILSSSVSTIGRNLDHYSLNAEEALSNSLSNCFLDVKNSDQFFSIPFWTTQDIVFSFYKNDLKLDDFFILYGPVTSPMTFLKIKKSKLSILKPFFWGGGMVGEVFNKNAFAKLDYKKFWAGSLPYEQIILLSKNFKAR